MSLKHKDLLAVWNQKEIPVIHRPGGGKPIRIRVPYAEDNRQWLKGTSRNKEPEWDKQFKCWKLPKTRFDNLVKCILNKHRKVYVIQPYRPKDTCAPACWNAGGFECECSCMGANHGQRNPNGNWFVVSETFAVNWKEREYACRVIEAVDENSE